MPNRGRAPILAWLLLGQIGIAAFGESVPSYIVDPSPSGLPQSSVISLAQTRDGYLWLGTLKGLARFDGNRFEVFTEWNTPGLISSTIVRLFADRGGGLWAGTAEGGTISIKDGQVKNLDLGSYGPGGQMVAACEDVTGAVWIYTADGRLARCRAGQVENVWRPTDTPFSNFRAVISEASGQLWFGTDTQLFSVVSDLGASPFELLLQTNALPGRLDGLVASRRGGFWQFANGRILKLQTNHTELDLGEYPWGTARIMAAIEDHEGNLAVGTQNSGLFRFEASGQSYSVPGLSQPTVLSLCEDREGNLWVGTDGGGLNRVKRNPFSVAEASRDWVVQSADEAPDGGLWLGFNGGGVTHWKEREWQDYGAAQGISPNFSAVLVDRAQRVWVGTRDAGLFEFVAGRFQPVRNVRLFGRNISAIHQDRGGRLWIGTDAGLACWEEPEWKWFNQQSGLTANQITAIADDAAGNLWFGTARNGLNRWHEGQFSALHQASGLPSENITSLCVDHDDVLWVGTGNGLGRLQAGHWTRFGTKDGLASDSIGYLIEDGQDKLWIGSNLGLMRAAKASVTDYTLSNAPAISIRVYGKGDGLPTSECTQGSQPAACRTRDGRMWFPTIRGLVTFDPALLVPNTNPPPVAIESVRLDDVEQNTNRLATSWLGNLTVPARAERLEIFYTSLNLAAPDRARFRYWMQGLEATWNSPTDVRRASYTKLPPGNYHFHVTACNEDGVWNREGISLAITVLPPFWRTWWFVTLAVAFGLGVIVGTVYFVSTQRLQRELGQLKQQEALEKERSRIARDLHDQLGANLTQVALLGEMVEEDKELPGEVASHAQQISQTARDTSNALDEIVWAANPANDTLEGLVSYACKFAQDYLTVAGLRYRLEVPAQLPKAEIPPDLRHNVFLAFKESVNNVVKHAQASEVKIRLRLNGNSFTIEVEDDGRGPGAASRKTGRNGLRNMRKRMEDVGGEFAMEPGEERGTRIRLTAPLGNR
jgi:ligand-binding sensor domain-containing protein/signal transduction histidine kinase